MTDPLEKQRQLLERAFDQLADSSVPLSAALDTATRLAQLRRDFVNLWWLRLESVGIERRAVFGLIDAEMEGRFVGEEYTRLRDEVIHQLMVRRSYVVDGKDLVVAQGALELESLLSLTDEAIKASQPPEGLHPTDLYLAQERHQKTLVALVPRRQQTVEVLNRIRSRIQSYLLQTEAAIELSVVATGAFERVRVAVDARLGDVAPEALVQFRAAYERASVGDNEARSHALTSCRRVLASVADALYPPSDVPLVGSDGKKHALTADKWKNRLYTFASERIANNASRSVTQANLDELDRRMSALNDLTSKAVHAGVSAEEVDQAIVQTYLLIGDLVRLPEPVSEPDVDSTAEVVGENGERPAE
jgi:hypothetical protein